jgi:hypothetical protein
MPIDLQTSGFISFLHIWRPHRRCQSFKASCLLVKGFKFYRSSINELGTLHCINTAWHYGAMHLILPFVPFRSSLFNFDTCTGRTAQPILMSFIPINADGPKEVSFGVSSRRNSFTGEYPFPKSFRRQFQC